MSANQSDKYSKLWKTAEEVHTPETVKIKGEIPKWLKGSFLRVGPGKFDFDNDFAMNHWFDGYSIISKFEVNGENGTVSFSCKYLQSDCYKRALKAQKPVVNEFGTRAYKEEGKNIFSRIMSTLIPELSDNANVAFFTLQEKLFVTGESCFFHELNPSTLTTGDRFDTNKLFGLYICTAHPLQDEAGYTYTIGTSVTTGLRHNILRIPPPTSGEKIKDQLKRSKIICSINSRWSTLISYNHSFGMTKNYIVYIEQPYLTNISKLLSASVQNKGESIRDWLEWTPTHSNRFYIVEKNSGKIVNRNYDIVSKDPFFFLHFINAFESEDGNSIIVDLSVYDSPDFLKEQELKVLRGNCTMGNCKLNDICNQASSKRFIIALNEIGDSKHISGKSITLSQPELIVEKGLELPVINRKFQSRDYQYYYASGLTSHGHFKNSICKIDVKAKTNVIWRESEYYIFGEPVFVPTENSEEEDSGVLIVPMTDCRNDKMDMILFLDAKNMSELGRANFKSNIPCSLHGKFVSN